MPATHPDLLQTFLRAVDAFNTNDYATFGSLLDDRATLTEIDHPLHTVRLKQPVIDFCQAKVNKDHAQFQTTGPISVDPQRGTVTGIAFWEDGVGAGRNSLKIKFHFIFSHDPTRGFLLLNMQAEPA